MGVEVDAIDMEVTITKEERLTYDGHLISVHNDPLWIQCDSCDEGHGFEKSVHGLHKWEAVLYLLNFMSDDCHGYGDTVEQRILNEMEKYVGKPADQGNLAAMRNDIRNVIGDDTSLDITGV